MTSFFCMFVFLSDLFHKIAEMAYSHGSLVLVDNSIMSLVPSHPLDLAVGVCRYFLFW